MKKLILITLLLAIIGVSHSEAQSRDSEKKAAVTKQLDSLNYLRELLVVEEIKLNHEMFRIFLDDIEYNIRMPFYSYMNTIDVPDLKNDIMKKLYEEQKSIEKRMEKFGMRDSMDRDFSVSRKISNVATASSVVTGRVSTSMDNLRSNPEYIETEKELSRVRRLLAIENAKYYIKEKMAKGEFINFNVIEQEKKRVMEHPLINRIAAQISFLERMIKAKEDKLF